MISLCAKLTGIRALWHFDNRWQLICGRLFFKDNPLAVYRKGEVEFLVDYDAGDHNGTRLCLISDIYTRFLPEMDLGNSVSVFDLGANGGGFPLMLLLNQRKIRKLVCVEMNPNAFRRLHYNITRNIKGEVHLIQAAICGERREFRLLLGSGDISDTIYQEPTRLDDSSRSEYSIQGRTFDDLFQSHFGNEVVDVCKMDIEGAEYEVLAMPEHQCLRYCRYLLVEIHAVQRERLEHFAGALSSAGFTLLNPGDNQVPGERLYVNERLQ